MNAGRNTSAVGPNSARLPRTSEKVQRKGTFEGGSERAAIKRNEIWPFVLPPFGSATNASRTPRPPTRGTAKRTCFTLSSLNEMSGY